MPRVTFIYPCIGRFPNTRYVRSWQMQPLSIAVLAGLTPAHWEKSFYDDRLEAIDYDAPTDLVAISIETYTARRGYQIATQFRQRGVPVVMGGYHARFCPEEVLENANAVCIGEAEGLWEEILNDTEKGCLKQRYHQTQWPDLAGIRPDRSLFEGKNYFKIVLMETGRGCRNRCSFCSIASYYNSTLRKRPVADIVGEIQALNERTVFFSDDNLTGDSNAAKELMRALIPLKIRWISQASVDVALDEELLELMRASGCMGVLIGMESLSERSLKAVNKGINRTVDYREALAALRRHQILVYGAFMFGLPGDTPATCEATTRFALEQHLFLAAFNHVVPFPGTPLYQKMKEQDRLRYDQWWLAEEFRFGELPFTPENMSADDVKALCYRSRRTFYGLPGILKRTSLRSTCRSPEYAKHFFSLNLLLQREVRQKRGIPLGVRDGKATTGRSPVEIELAHPEDNPAIQALLAKESVPGNIEVSYRRVPDYFRALEVEGRTSETIVARVKGNGRIVGVASQSAKVVYINGQPSEVGYLGSLRIDREFRNGSLLARGYHLLHERHREKNNVKFYLSTIIEKNEQVRSLLTSGRTSLPVYHDLGQFYSMAIALKSDKPSTPNEGLTLRPANEADLEALATFLNREGARRQFFPQYVAEDLASNEGLLRGLSPEHIWLTLEGEQIIGCAGAWDQSASRQQCIEAYRGILSLLRPVYNQVAPLLGYPTLPPVHAMLNHGLLSLVCIREDNLAVFAALLQAIIHQNAGQHDCLMAGMHEQDPLLPVLKRYRHIPYTSRLYAVYWPEDREALLALDDRIPYLELGSL